MGRSKSRSKKSDKPDSDNESTRSSSKKRSSSKRSKSRRRKDSGEHVCRSCRCDDYCTKCNKQLHSSDYDSDGSDAENGGGPDGNGAEGRPDWDGGEPVNEAELIELAQGDTPEAKEARRRLRKEHADGKWSDFYNRQGVDTSKPKSILIFKNGDEYDPGMIVKVTRKNYKNWVGFLDELTKKYKDGKTVHEIYTTDGNEIRHFRGLAHGGEYVAVNKKYRQVEYGKKKNKKWTHFMQVPEEHQRKLDSEESVKWYLEKKEFEPKLGDIWDDKNFDKKHVHDWDD